MNKKEPLPLDNTGTGKLGSIRVVTRREDMMKTLDRIKRSKYGNRI